MLTLLIVTTIIGTAAYLLALVSDGVAYELSRSVEAAFDFVEHRLALRSSRRKPQPKAEARVAFKVSRSRAG